MIAQTKLVAEMTNRIIVSAMKKDEVNAMLAKTVKALLKRCMCILSVIS